MEAVRLRLTQAEVDWLVDLHKHDVRLRRPPACCDERFCLSGPCPETAKMLYHKFPRESVLKRLLAETRKEEN